MSDSEPDLNFLRRKLEQLGAGAPNTPLSAEPRTRTSPSVPDPISREELNDKLALAEARTETRFVHLDANIRALTATISEKGGLLDQVGDLRADSKATRGTIVVTAISSFLGMLAIAVGLAIGLGQMDLAHQANLLAAFKR